MYNSLYHFELWLSVFRLRQLVPQSTPGAQLHLELAQVQKHLFSLVLFLPSISLSLHWPDLRFPLSLLLLFWQFEPVLPHPDHNHRRQRRNLLEHFIMSYTQNQYMMYGIKSIVR